MKILFMILELGLLCIQFFFSHAAEPQLSLPPKITLSVLPEDAVEGREVPLYITIDHMEKDGIDIASFFLEDNNIPVVFISNQSLLPSEKGDPYNLVTSRYKTILPFKKSGLYNVGPVSARVGGIRFSSGHISVSIQPAVVSEELRLEAEIKAPPHIYIGQEVLFEYRIYFFKPMQLFREDLPLLNAPGFVNIGSPEIITKTVQDQHIQIIQQVAKATKSGKFAILPSIIEGMAVTTVAGAPHSIPPLYRATTQEAVIEVLPFPEPIPDEFYGALGSFLWRVIVDDTKLSFKDSIAVQYIVSGRGDMGTVQFPPFSQIPELERNFWISGDPPLGKEENGVKKFTLNLKPRYVGKQKIPGFVFCSFDPISGTYRKSVVPSTVIVVEGKEGDQPIPTVLPESVFAPFSFEKFSKISYAAPLNVVYVVVSICFLFLGLEFFLKRHFDKRRMQVRQESSTLFYAAIMNKGKPERALNGLKQAFLLRLFEVKLTPTLLSGTEELPETGIVLDVKNLLRAIDRQLYQKNVAGMGVKEIYDEAGLLYSRLKNIR